MTINTKKPFSLRMLLLVLSVATTACAQNGVWWEAEEYTQTDFPDRTRFSPETERERDLLSGGNWVSVDQYDGQQPFLEYTVSVPETANYYFYARRFFSHGPLRYRFDDAPWQEVTDLRLMDGFNLRLFVSVNWVKLGNVELAEGVHTLRIEQIPGEKHNVAAYDCFLLSPEPFIPRGKFKPGEKSGRAMPGHFAFEPPADPLTEDALLNLRFLNEPVAGETGPITRKGDKFYRGDGEEIRFWTMTLYSTSWDHETLDYMVRRLARQGFNMLRVYIPVFDPKADSLAALDKTNIDIYQYLTHRCKQEGMYVSINTFFSPMCHMKESYGFEGYEENEAPHNLPYVSPRFQSYYKYWVRELLTRDNPYTGIPLADDPAVAMIEILSEDTLFWWLALPDEQKVLLEKEFGLWAIGKYGSLENSYRAWGGEPWKIDLPDQTVLRLFDWYKMTVRGYQELTPPQQKRCSDQVNFLRDFQRDFFQRMVGFHRDLGYKGLLSPTGFGTIDPSVLEDIEHYTHLVTDTIDRHHYPLTPHLNPTRSFMSTYAVHEGDFFKSMSLLKDPLATVLRYKTVKGAPAIISEFGWVNPNYYKLEAPLFTAAYASLIGLDCLQWFGGQGAIDYSHKLEKFAFRCPEIMVQNPAAAMIYRLQYVKEGPEVVLEALDPETLATPIATRQIYDMRGYDPTRGQDEMLEQKEREGGIDPLAFFVGKVQADFTPNGTDYIHPELGQRINHEQKTITSLTDELILDYGQGRLTINTPKAQAVCGFCQKDDPVELRDLTIRAGNPFSAIAIVPLDDLPLSESRKILVQTATPGWPYGFQAEPASFQKGNLPVDGERIVNAGSQPWNLEQINGAITFKRQPLSATILDGNGYAAGKGDLDGNRLRLPQNQCYVIVDFK